ncbi:TPA: lipoprotein YedD [Klebsiella aerogenes]|uniref:lipoprotein YedD n=1 Tax=Klebsiella TaxID=570 RepID=UPI000B1BE8ED|nr:MULTISPECIES: lipoprotein YedD [Klebsiella]EKW8938391.1 lipoprotein [Klebsiella aerogenes]EKZ9717597.1 lipoprotein [Klebsiella aerogenes]MDM8053848.1 lipoprotein YedD [Klebsiella aerogenes]MDM8082749.1 lipoprotein YedD [Klebsiella aerogenes]MDT8883217.1 lipoprotein YedD [Klebsiella aerogenes]
MMKKIVMAGALLALAGCVQVDTYQAVVKAPAPAGLEGFWQSKGPQSAMVSPEAIATFIVTKDGDTLDCRQWQRVIAEPGKLMNRDDQVYNVTSSLDIYPIERNGNTLEYDRMTLTRVERLTPECEEAWKKNQAASKTAP